MINNHFGAPPTKPFSRSSGLSALTSGPRVYLPLVGERLNAKSRRVQINTRLAKATNRNYEILDQDPDRRSNLRSDDQGRVGPKQPVGQRHGCRPLPRWNAGVGGLAASITNSGFSVVSAFQRHESLVCKSRDAPIE